LRARFETASVLRHSLDNPEWRRFYSNDKIAILVCDYRAEEGLNLQGREAVLVHFDLPFSPGRIEQRMGRLDRFSRGKPVRSILLCADGNAWEESWLSFMNEGLGVFSDSIASLQYSTSDWIAQGTKKSFTLGSEAWDDLARQLDGASGEVAKQKRLIAEQDAMDLMDLSDDTSEALVSRLHALETPAFLRSFPETLADWAEKALSIKLCEDDRNHPGVFRLVVSEDRTLIPQRQFETYFAGALDATYKPTPWAKDARAASRKMSFRRRLAQERRCLVARYGEQFLDALYAYTRKDDRGRCYALWRGRRNMPKRCEGVYLRFDFVIEAEDSQALTAFGDAVDPRAIRREADAILSPMHLEIWLDADHEIVADTAILALLHAPLVSPPGPSQDGDFDLDHRRWATAVAQHDGFRDWHVRLRRSAQVAREKVGDLHRVRGHIAEAKKSAEDWLRNFECQMASRLVVLPEAGRKAEVRQLDGELAWRKAIIDSLDKPRLLLDSVGVIVLDRRSFNN
jgi:ATP-dependent helicase HepA